MNMILLPLSLGAVQALLLTLGAPLLLGVILKLTRWIEGRADTLPEESVSITCFYKFLEAGWRNKASHPAGQVVFLCTFLAASMLPGFLGTRISFGDGFILVMLLTAGLVLQAAVKMFAGVLSPEGGCSAMHHASFVDVVYVTAALFLLIAGTGFQRQGTMLTDLAFLFQGYYLTGAAFLTASGAFLLVLIALSQARALLFSWQKSIPLTGEADLWQMLGILLQAVIYLLLFAQICLPVPVPIGIRFFIGAVLASVGMAFCGSVFQSQGTMSQAAAVFLFLSFLAR